MPAAGNVVGRASRDRSSAPALFKGVQSKDRAVVNERSRPFSFTP